jgi:uncharacterized membrane protein
MSNLNFGNFSKTRIEAFSDGIFAIVVTLLVLEIRLPHLHEITNGEFLHSLSEIIPKIISWVNSFLVVCVIWMNHHRLLDMFKRIDAGIFWFNNILLMFISFIPFPTAILGEYTNLEYAVAFYGFCLSLMGLGFIMLRLYVQKRPELLQEHIELADFKRGTKASFYYGFMLYFSGALISLINPWVAFAVYFFIPVYFIFPKGTTGKLK